MAVVPGTSLCPPGARRIPAVVWDAAVEAKRCRDMATAAAQQLLARAAAEADSIRTSAAQQGHEEGLARASELLCRLAADRDRLMIEMEQQLVDLAFAIASRVVELTAERDRRVVVDVAARALERARDRTDVTFRANPIDIAALRESEPVLLERMSRARRIAVVADTSVAAGGVVVESEVGSIDARLSTQLEGLRRALQGSGA